MNLGEMALYATLDRVRNELTAAGLVGNDPVLPEQLYRFDQIHYHGTEAVQRAIDTLEIGPHTRVLDIGSGLGGPARYLAATAGATITAVELQPEMHEIGQALTRRSGLEQKVEHRLGDILSCPLPVAGFEAAVSWLAVHHIPRRPQLLERIAGALRPDGWIYIEDLYARRSFVDTLLYAVTLTSIEQYRVDLERAGFENIVVEDTSADWGTFCAGRATAWRTGRDRHLGVHGPEIFERLDGFFHGVAQLFTEESLGGVRIVAQAKGRHPRAGAI